MRLEIANKKYGWLQGTDVAVTTAKEREPRSSVPSVLCCGCYGSLAELVTCWLRSPDSRVSSLGDDRCVSLPCAQLGAVAALL